MAGIALLATRPPIHLYTYRTRTGIYETCRRPKELVAYERLTPRLREILALVADGQTSKEIAAKSDRKE